jgi:pimeloyl-ACP methyl ester carboxylesterase
MSRAEPVPVALEERSVTVADGTTIAVRVHDAPGEGVAVLVVHDLGSNARIWDSVAGELAAAGHGVAAVDVRGHGRSAKPEDGYDFATLADDLVAVLDALGWAEPVVAAGAGWGGNVVLEAAVRHPSRLAALALIDGGTIELSGRYADWPTCAVALAPASIEGRAAASVERMLRLRHPEWPESAIAGTLADVEVLDDGTVRPWLSASTHLAILEQLWAQHPAELYPAVPTPVLLVAAGDPAAPAARFEAAARQELVEAQAGLSTVATTWIDGDADPVVEHPARIAELLEAVAVGSIFAGR